MSWDLMIMDQPREARTLSDIPEDFRPQPLGSRAALAARIVEAFPAARFSNPAWGRIGGEGWSIELNMGRGEVCDSITLHVRGGPSAMEAVVTLLRHLNLRGFDCQTSEFFDEAAAIESFNAWRCFRDRVT
jgi:hypothetical protein